MLLSLFAHQFTMRTLSTAIRERILTLLNSGASGYAIHHATGASTGAISKIRSEYCPDIPKSSGGHSHKLTPANINYARHIIHMRKADNAVQVTKALKDVTNQSISAQTVRCNLREFGL
jgi:hypothetical protein